MTTLSLLQEGYESIGNVGEKFFISAQHNMLYDSRKLHLWYLNTGDDLIIASDFKDYYHLDKEEDDGDYYQTLDVFAIHKKGDMLFIASVYEHMFNTGNVDEFLELVNEVKNETKVEKIEALSVLPHLDCDHKYKELLDMIKWYNIEDDEMNHLDELLEKITNVSRLIKQ